MTFCIAVYLSKFASSSFGGSPDGLFGTYLFTSQDSTHTPVTVLYSKLTVCALYLLRERRWWLQCADVLVMRGLHGWAGLYSPSKRVKRLSHRVKSAILVLQKLFLINGADESHEDLVHCA